jgi:hypothetical protein
MLLDRDDDQIKLSELLCRIPWKYQCHPSKTHRVDGLETDVSFLDS